MSINEYICVAKLTPRTYQRLHSQVITSGFMKRVSIHKMGYSLLINSILCFLPENVTIVDGHIHLTEQSERETKLTACHMCNCSAMEAEETSTLAGAYR